MSDIDDQYLFEAECRARRFSGAYTGTSGTLAGDVIRCLKLISSLRKEIAQMQQDGKSTSCDVSKTWILDGADELRRSRETRLPGDGILASEPDMHPAEKLLLDTVDVVRQRRLTYGGPTNHFARTVGAINAIFADKLRSPLTISEWAQIMILDKVSRSQGEQKTRDSQIDCAGYAACWAECESPQP